MERVKDAIEKAALERASLPGAGIAAAPPVPSPAPLAPPAGRGSPAGPAALRAPGAGPACDWTDFRAVTLSARRLRRNRIITQDRSEPAHVSFDLLRTRILKTFRDRGWTRLAITSPTKGCGKTFVTANLALSLARQSDIRTLAVDMDLRLPTLAMALGLRERLVLKDLLTGAVPAATHLRRVGDNLALALNTERVRDAAELIQERQTAEQLGRLNILLAPDIVLYDLPPVLVTDDAFAFLHHVDAVLLVAAGGSTRADQIEACERLFREAGTEFLGVILNKAEQTRQSSYEYGYG